MGLLLPEPPFRLSEVARKLSDQVQAAPTPDAAPPSTERAKAFLDTSPLPSATSPTRISLRRPSRCGRSHATHGSPAVRWIFDFKHLARRALDPLPANQHERFLKRCRVTARLSDSCHDGLHRSSVAPSKLRWPTRLRTGAAATSALQNRVFMDTSEHVCAPVRSGDAVGSNRPRFRARTRALARTGNNHHHSHRRAACRIDFLCQRHGMSPS